MLIRRKPLPVATLHLSALAELLALCTFFLAVQFDRGRVIGVVALAPYRGVDEQTLRLVLTREELTIALAFDGVIDAARVRSGRVDVQWLQKSLRRVDEVRTGHRSVALFVDDDVLLDDAIAVIDVCLGAGLSVAIDPAFGVARHAAHPFSSPDAPLAGGTNSVLHPTRCLPLESSRFSGVRSSEAARGRRRSSTCFGQSQRSP